MADVPFPIDQFYNLKVLILVEKEPLTDCFEQLVLTEEQFKPVLKMLTDQMPETACGECVVHKGDKHFCVTTNEDVAAKFPEVKAVYTQDEVDAME